MKTLLALVSIALLFAVEAFAASAGAEPRAAGAPTLLLDPNHNLHVSYTQTGHLPSQLPLFQSIIYARLDFTGTTWVMSGATPEA